MTDLDRIKKGLKKLKLDFLKKDLSLQLEVLDMTMKLDPSSLWDPVSQVYQDLSNEKQVIKKKIQAIDEIVKDLSCPSADSNPLKRRLS